MIPPLTILAAVDFSEGSRAALNFASRLAAHCGSALHVLHAEDPLLSAAARQLGRDLGEETLEELRRFTNETWPTATRHPRLHAVTGHAPDVIVDIGAREGADVIVVGSRGMSGAERLIFGSTTEYVLRRADRSVLVVPPHWTSQPTDTPDLTGIGPVIVGMDFGESAMLAAGAARQLATSLHTSVEVVHVVPGAHVLERWRPEAERMALEREASARRELTAAVVGLPGTAPLATRVEVGDVAERITSVVTAYAQRHPLLVLGRRTGTTRGAAPGAVAYRVLMAAAAPVLVHVAET
jgi:nucleotide-binding universal stress UspA family protein